MFPIPWNFPFRKKNGNLVNIGDAIDEGTELPEHGEGDAGKVLSVDENGDLEWSDDVNTEIQTLSNNVKARAELSAYNLLNIANSEINTSGTYTEVINSDGTVTIGGTPVSACTIPYKATAKYNGSVYNLKTSTDYVLDSGLESISPLTLQVFVKEESTSSWSKIAETTDETKLSFTTPEAFYDLWARVLVPADAVVLVDTIVKPMITLASDITIAFVPYAMSNRELTEHVKRIEGKYVVVDINKSIKVMANGVKTAQDLLNDLASEYVAMVQALPDGEATSVTGVNVYVPTASAASAFPSITTFSRSLNTNSNTSSLNVIFRGFVLDTSKLMAVNVKVHSTLSSCEIKGYNLLNNNLPFDDGDGVIPSGTNFTLYYTEYTKVS